MSWRSSVSTARFNKTVSSLRLAGVLITRVRRLVVSVRLRLKAAGAAALANQTSNLIAGQKESRGEKVTVTFSPLLSFYTMLSVFGGLAIIGAMYTCYITCI